MNGYFKDNGLGKKHPIGRKHKNNSATPKITLKKYKGELEVAFCIFSIITNNLGGSIFM